MPIRKLSIPAMLMLSFFSFFPDQIIAFFRELIISLRSHQGINGTCRGLCLAIAGRLPEFVCP